MDMQPSISKNICHLDGCDHDVMYPGDQICQMHYFRRMRTGSFDIQKKARKASTITPNGYVRIFKPGHPLSIRGYVFEHRYVLFEALKGKVSECDLCGKAVTWETVHVDHKDERRKNNERENLRPLCNPCNTRRNYPERHTFSNSIPITYEGVTMTPHEWARDERVDICGATIRSRKIKGMTDYDALFKEKLTNKVAKRNR